MAEDVRFRSFTMHRLAWKEVLQDARAPTDSAWSLLGGKCKGSFQMKEEME